MVKFRTMADLRDAGGEPMPDAMRLSRVGRWLRSTSLDEWPALWTVLRGDMSLVGPRPLLTKYLPRYSARQARRHEVRPGITGLAQVRGRNALPWDERLELDVQYVERLSFALDAKILVQTIGLVVWRRGISQPGRATVDEFMGAPRR
jgi:lipopolysaccharide/colanic/teichoic acid biosynthesis glycosyltransferase